MTQPDLSALQARAYDLYSRFDRGAQAPDGALLGQAVAALAVHAKHLRRAQLSPIVSSGTEVDPVAPVLVESLDTLLVAGAIIGLDLGRAMSAHSETHQQPLLAASAAHIHKLQQLLKGAGDRPLSASAREAAREPVTAMAWRVQTELQSRGVKIARALEGHWQGHYGFGRPAGAARTGPAPRP